MKRIIFLLLLSIALQIPASLFAAIDRPDRAPGVAPASELPRAEEQSFRAPSGEAQEMALCLAVIIGCAVPALIFLQHCVNARTRELSEEVLRRVEREKELEREKTFVESIIASLPVCFYVHDGQRFLRWNGAFQEAMGLSDAELARLRPRELIHHEDLALTTRKRDEIVERGEASWEARLLTRRGARRHFITGRRMEAGGGVYMLGTATDVTDSRTAELALLASEMRFREMLENLRLMAVMLDREGRVTFCNDFLLQSTGWYRCEVMGKDWCSNFSPDPHEAREALLDLFSGGTPQRVRTIVTRHGRPRIISWNSTILRDHDGEPVGIASIGEDITERREAERALRESEEKYRLLFDRMLNGYAVCEVICDEQGKPVDYRYLEVNASYEALLGRSRGDLVGKRVLELAPDMECHWIERLGAAAVTGKPDQFEDFCSVLGKWFKVAVYAPAPGQFAATFTDITKRKLAEQALTESEEHVRQIFSQSDDGMILFRMDDFEMVDVNSAALHLFGIPKDDFMTHKPWELICRSDFCRLVRMLAKADELGGFLLERGTCCRPDGGVFLAAIRGKVLSLRSEYVVLCSVRDITQKARLEDEMKATQAKLIQANKMSSLGMLVSGIAHEINNPNNFISVNSVMLSDVWRDAAPILSRYRDQHGEFNLGGLPYSEMESVAPRLVAGITDGSNRITSIVNNMRNFVRREEGGLKGAIDINRSIESVTSLLWHHIHRHTDFFTASLGEGLPPARGSAQQIEQVLINLIMNALQALPGKDFGVCVSSSFDKETGMVAVSVTDEGYGMNRKVLRQLTEPFFSTKIAQGGTGLGLYISSSIIKEHRGVFSFDSSPGKGTTATFRLPVAGGDSEGQP